jgi:hypothetical protein
MVHPKRLFMRRIVPAACGVLLAAAAVAQAPAALPLQNLEDNNRIVVELRVAG